MAACSLGKCRRAGGGDRLDAFAVVALFKGEAAAPPVGRLIRGGGCALTTIGVAQVVDHLVRLVGVAEEDAVLDVAQLGLQDPVEPSEASAIQAALLRAPPLPPEGAER